MAQWKKTFFNIGNSPEYIPDPRADEAIRMGELLARNRQVQIEAADRLFGQRQQTAEFDERRRQFNETQKRYADAQKMAQAEADRGYGLEERKLGQGDERERRMAAEAIAQRAAEEARAQRGFDLQREGYDLQKEDLGARNADRQTDNERQRAAAEEQKRQFDTGEANKVTADEREAARRKTEQEAATERAYELQRRGREQEASIEAERIRVQEEKLRTEIQKETDKRAAKEAEDAAKATALKEERARQGLAAARAKFREKFVAAKETAKGGFVDDATLKQLASSVMAPGVDEEAPDFRDVGGRVVQEWRPSDVQEANALRDLLLETILELQPEGKTKPYHDQERGSVEEALMQIGRWSGWASGPTQMFDWLSSESMEDPNSPTSADALRRALNEATTSNSRLFQLPQKKRK